MREGHRSVSFCVKDIIGFQNKDFRKSPYPKPISDRQTSPLSLWLAMLEKPRAGLQSQPPTHHRNRPSSTHLDFLTGPDWGRL